MIKQPGDAGPYSQSRDNTKGDMLFSKASYGMWACVTWDAVVAYRAGDYGRIWLVFLGIITGHLYYFLTVWLPRAGGARPLVPVPALPDCLLAVHRCTRTRTHSLWPPPWPGSSFPDCVRQSLCT
jgi:hypothetical protein